MIITWQSPDLAGLFLSALPLWCAMSVLSCVRKCNIHSLSLQCCDVLRVHEMVACDRADQGENIGQFHSALAVRMVCLLQLIPANTNLGFCLLKV